MKTLALLLALAGCSIFVSPSHADDAPAGLANVSANQPAVAVAGTAGEQKLTDVRKIFVGSLGTVSGSEYIRQRLINALAKSSGITVVDSAEKADAVLLGSAEIGHHRTFTLGPCFVSSVPNFQADTALRLEGKDHKILWTDEVSTRRHFSHLSGKGASADVVAKIVNRLSEAVNANDAQLASKKSVTHM